MVRVETTKGLNYCRTCSADFASVAAFDRHRVGTYDPHDRRCMDDRELAAAGMAANARGRWFIVTDTERIRERFAEAA